MSDTVRTDTVRVTGWYILADGRSSGPWDDETIIGWIRQGISVASIRPDTSDESFPWVPLDSHGPFAKELATTRDRNEFHSTGAGDRHPILPVPGNVSRSALPPTAATPPVDAYPQPGNFPSQPMKSTVGNGLLDALVLASLVLGAGFVLFGVLSGSLFGKRTDSDSTDVALPTKLTAKTATHDLTAQVELDGVSIEPLPIEPGPPQAWRISGRARNVGLDIVTSVTLEIGAWDCPKGRKRKRDAGTVRSDCEQIYQKQVSLREPIPPGQARNFRESFVTSDLTTRGDLMWTYPTRVYPSER